MSKKKPFYKSWVIMISASTVIVDIINLLVEQPFIPEKYRGVLSLVSGILVIIARTQSSGAQIGKTNE